MKTTTIRKRNSVVMRYTINGKKQDIYTGVTATDEQWNKKRKLIKGEGEAVAADNQLLVDYRNAIEAYVTDLKRENKAYDHQELKDHLYNIFDSEFKSTENYGLVDLYDSHIEKIKKKFKARTATSYKNSKRHLKEYLETKNQKNIAFDKVDVDFCDDFIYYLQHRQSLSPTSRGKQIKNLKAVMAAGLLAGVHQNVKYQFFKKENENSVKVYLNNDEIQLMSTTKCVNEIEEKIRDVFTFICLTGIRYQDYFQLSEENFKQIDGYWYIMFDQSKTSEEVKVPVIFKQAIEILEKYNFSLPKYSNAYLNRELKDFFKRAKLFEEKIKINKEQKKGSFLKRDLLSIHSGRRSFATNQFLKGIPISQIMAATGHSTEGAFRLYIKADKLEKARKLANYADY